MKMSTKEPGGGGADPVEVRRHDAVPGAGSAHADDLPGAKAGGEKGQPGYADERGLVRDGA